MACLQVTIVTALLPFAPTITQICTTHIMVQSCFGGGYWDNLLQWDNNDSWKN